MADYASLSLEGTIAGAVTETPKGDTQAPVRVTVGAGETLRLTVTAPGSTLHGFSDGDRIYVRGRLLPGERVRANTVRSV